MTDLEADVYAITLNADSLPKDVGVAAEASRSDTLLHPVQVREI